MYHGTGKLPETFQNGWGAGKKAELVFKNANVFMAHTGEFVSGDVAVAGGVVLGVGSYEGETEIDVGGKYLCPGFIDSHLHLSPLW